MPSHPHIQAAERTLYRTKRSLSVLGMMLFKSVWQGAIGGIFFGLIAVAVISGEFSVPIFSVVMILTILALSYRRQVIWKETTLTITTQRILYHRYDSLFKSSTHTINWDRYQDSTYTAGALDRATNTGELTIHFGTAGAERTLEITKLTWAQDLKHYLDKIHNLKVMKQADINLPFFVPAKKGRRDKAVLSYHD
jgi:membrane protein YdbS with pleckstrin-like domain